MTNDEKLQYALARQGLAMEFGFDDDYDLFTKHIAELRAAELPDGADSGTQMPCEHEWELRGMNSICKKCGELYYSASS